MDLVLRATFAFFLIFLMTRLIGRRELGKLQAFDLILFIVIGDLVQQGITQSDYSVTGLVLVLSTISLLTVFVSYVSFRFPRVRPLLEGEPVVVLEDGRLIEENMRRTRLTIDDVEEEARLQQIASLEDVRWAVFENGGSISFIPKETCPPARPRRPRARSGRAPRRSIRRSARGRSPPPGRGRSSPAGRRPRARAGSPRRRAGLSALEPRCGGRARLRAVSAPRRTEGRSRRARPPRGRGR